MRRRILLIVWIGLGLSVGCVAPRGETLVQPSPVVPTRIEPTMPPTATLLPTITPNAPTETPVVATPTVTPTLASVVVRRTVPTPTRTVTPGLYITNLRADPSPPTRTTEMYFTATFLNATEFVQTHRWSVYIFRADGTNRIGEVTQTQTHIPLGASEQRALGAWRLGPGGPCEEVILRAVYFGDDNKPVSFQPLGGGTFEKKLTLCP